MSTPDPSSRPFAISGAPQSGEPKKNGCLKWGAIIAGGFLLFGALINSCTPESDNGTTQTTEVTVTTTVSEDQEATTVTETETVTVTEQAQAEEPELPAEEVGTDPADADQRLGFVAPPPAAPAPAPAATNASYGNCTDVWNAIGGPIYAGSPGFASKFDGDGDGVGCESDPR